MVEEKEYQWHSSTLIEQHYLHMGLEPQFIATKSLVYLVKYCPLDEVQQKR